ncbi:MAG: uncharacterized DUF497 family protein [Planctomycetota bacterium]|jgi:uncharacterized DUF497 family protein
MLDDDQIEWDEVKSITNKAKHGVSFEEAAALFSSGDDYVEVFDEAHSDEEERFIAIGPIRRGLVLVVWTEREEGMARIISARWATRREHTAFRSAMDDQA